jgi:quinol monooxygenase YgiN
MTGGALRQRPAPSGRTNTMSKPVKIMAILTALPGKTDALEALLKGMVAPSRAEPGNLRWDLWQDKSDPARFAIDELYRDNAAVAARTISRRSTRWPNVSPASSIRSRSTDRRTPPKPAF